MAKNKSLSAQIEEIEASKEKLLAYESLFSKCCQLNFNYSAKNLKKILEKNDEPSSNFESKICNFFSLKNEKEMDLFIQIVCTESVLNYYKNEILKNEE